MNLEEALRRHFFIGKVFADPKNGHACLSFSKFVKADLQQNAIALRLFTGWEEYINVL